MKINTKYTDERIDLIKRFDALPDYMLIDTQMLAVIKGVTPIAIRADRREKRGTGLIPHIKKAAWCTTANLMS